MISLVDRLPKGLPYRLLIESFFTRFKLFKGLNKAGVARFGTIRKNKTKKCLMDLKAIKIRR